MKIAKILGIMLSFITVIWVVTILLVCAPLVLLVRLLELPLPLSLQAAMWMDIVGAHKLDANYRAKLGLEPHALSPKQRTVVLLMRIIITPLVFTLKFLMFLLPLLGKAIVWSFLIGNKFGDLDTLLKAFAEEDFPDDDDEESLVDLAIPRRPYFKQALEEPLCPACGTHLLHEFCDYLVLLGDMKNPETFIVSSDGGYFCPECPVVVLDMEQFVEDIAEGGELPKELGVAGIIDWDEEAADKDVRIVQLDEEDEETVRVVPFLGGDTFAPVKNMSKVGRNDPCPCGSGKKYKKCCMNRA